MKGTNLIIEISIQLQFSIKPEDKKLIKAKEKK